MSKLSQAALLISAMQKRAAEIAATYTAGQLESPSRIVPEAFAGVASDGRPLKTLMVGASVAASRGNDPEAWLMMIGKTQIADVSRAVVRTGMAVEDAMATRIANLPCCPRCAQLAGRVYHWGSGFSRHPGCDCTLEPKPGTATLDLEQHEIPLDQIRGLSKADREAVELGADLGSVVNAHRGMYTTETHGRKVKATLDSTMRRTSKYPDGVRLRPESILAHAKDQEDAVRLLTKYGYIR